MQIIVGLSEQYRAAQDKRQRERFIADGTPMKPIPHELSLELPAAELTAASRQALLLAQGGRLSLPDTYGGFPADTIPAAPAEWDKLLAQYAAAHRLALAASQQEKQEAARRQAEDQERKERRAEQALRDREREQADKAARAQQRAEWITEHGSEHLRAAVNAGYNCQRLYTSERAALEYPGYEIDFDGNAAWKSRSCPSTGALAEELRVTPSLREGERIAVVWLTHGIGSDDRDEDDPEEYQEREAVAIDNWLGRYTLLRTDFGPA